MESIKSVISNLLGQDIISLEVQDVLGTQVIYLTYRDNIPTQSVKSRVLSVDAEAEFEELIRVYSDEVIQRTYTQMYADSDYERYWEDPAVGERIDTYLSDKTVSARVIGNAGKRNGGVCNMEIARGA